MYYKIIYTEFTYILKLEHNQLKWNDMKNVGTTEQVNPEHVPKSPTVDMATADARKQDDTRANLANGTFYISRMLEVENYLPTISKNGGPRIHYRVHCNIIQH